jgi:hypothetical protein
MMKGDRAWTYERTPPRGDGGRPRNFSLYAWRVYHVTEEGYVLQHLNPELAGVPRRLEYYPRGMVLDDAGADRIRSSAAEADIREGDLVLVLEEFGTLSQGVVVATTPKMADVLMSDGSTRAPSSARAPAPGPTRRCSKLSLVRITQPDEDGLSQTKSPTVATT